MSSQITSPTTSQSSTRTDRHLLQSILEGLVDGVLILTMEGDWVYANQHAHQMCCQLSLGQPMPGSVPQALWQICQTLRQVTRESAGATAVVESEIAIAHRIHYRVRVRWLHLEESQKPYLLVTLEDCYEAMRSRAIAETNQYALTRRQAEVWQLHRTGHTYREIAEHLFVSLNTVKRHMKDIYAKQKQPEPLAGVERMK